MTKETLWRKVEAILFYLGTLYVVFLVYYVIVYRPKLDSWSFLGEMFALIVVSLWWQAFKGRLAKFIRESIRGMIVEEFAASRMSQSESEGVSGGLNPS